MKTGHQSRPAGFPSWPMVWFDERGESCTVSGIHLTPARVLFARWLAWAFTVALLVFIAVRCWGFHVSDVVCRVVVWGGDLFGYRTTFDQRKWIYAALYVVCWIVRPTVARLLAFLLQGAMRKRTTVRFTANTLKLRRCCWIAKRYDRRIVELTFMVRPRADLPYIQSTARSRNSPETSLLHSETRDLVMLYGIRQVRVARLVSPEQAEQFSAVLQAVNAMRLKQATQAMTSRAPHLVNVADI